VTVALLCAVVALGLTPEQVREVCFARASSVVSVKASISLTATDGRHIYMSDGTVRYTAPDQFRVIVYRRIAKRQLAFDFGVNGESSWFRDYLRNQQRDNPVVEPAGLLWLLGLSPPISKASAWRDGNSVAVAVRGPGRVCVARLDAKTAALRSSVVYRDGRLIGWCRYRKVNARGIPVSGIIMVGESRMEWVLYDVRIEISS